MNVAVIPARGGSKRVPRKNIRLFCGKPMIAWSIEAAKASELFSHILVSTEDDEIARVAESSGAEVPFRRPGNLSNDFTPTMPVIRHAIDWMTSHIGRPDHVCCLYATAPFVTPDILSEAFHQLISSPETEFVFSATEFKHPIFRALQLRSDATVEMLFPEHELTRSQDLPTSYHDAGQFYWGRTNAFFEHEGFFSARSWLYRLPHHRVHDIDSPDDWTRAELVFNALQNELSDD